MVVMPNLENYSIEKLCALGNSSDNIFTRDDIKYLLEIRVLNLNESLFYLLNKFRCFKGIIKEVYAKVILIKLTEEEYYIENGIIDDILSLISLDDLVKYGSNACSLEIRKKCEELFWLNAVIIEDVSELNKKNAMYRRRALVEKIKCGR